MATKKQATPAHAPELLEVLAAAEALAKQYTTISPSTHLIGGIETSATPMGRAGNLRINQQWLALVEALHAARIAGVKIGGAA